MFGVLFHPLLWSRFENVHAISSNHIREPLSVLSYIYTCYCDAPLLESLCRFLHSLIRNGCLQLWIMREYAIMISSLLLVISHALLEKPSFIIYRWFEQQNGQNWPIFAHIKTSIGTHLLELSNLFSHDFPGCASYTPPLTGAFPASDVHRSTWNIPPSNRTLCEPIQGQPKSVPNVHTYIYIYLYIVKYVYKS